MKIIRGRDLEFTPASHENPDDPGCLKKVLATKADLLDGRVQMVNWSKLPIGKSFQRHFHEDMQEVFVIMNGEAQMQIENRTFELSGGDAVLVEPKEQHDMTNVGDTDIDYVVFGISMETGGKTVVVQP